MTARGWWATHLYSRRSVGRDIEEFPGWPALLRLVEACESDLERAFVATLFSCDSRVSEALQLRDHHFEVDREEGLIIVRGAPLRNGTGSLRSCQAEAGRRLRSRRCGEEIWPHWFRSQRASQLASEYGFELHALIDFFDWKDVETALTYSRLGAKRLTALMVKGQGELNENKETRETLREKVAQLQQENEQLRAAVQEAPGW